MSGQLKVDKIFSDIQVISKLLPPIHSFSEATGGVLHQNKGNNMYWKIEGNSKTNSQDSGPE